MSIQKLRDLAKEDVPSWYKNTWNVAPPNWREVSQAEFVASGFFTYGASYQEYTQFQDKKCGWFSGNLYYVAGRPEGVGMQSAYENGVFIIKFYRFANCIHQYEAVNRARIEELAKKFPELKGKGTWGRCCHNSVCTKCGDYRFVDSSD